MKQMKFCTILLIYLLNKATVTLSSKAIKRVPQAEKSMPEFNECMVGMKLITEMPVDDVIVPPQSSNEPTMRNFLAPYLLFVMKSSHFFTTQDRSILSFLQTPHYFTIDIGPHGYVIEID